MSDSLPRKPIQIDRSEPHMVRKAKIYDLIDELKAAGQWDFAAYKQLRAEWIDACRHVGSALGYFIRSFDDAHPEFAARLMEEYRAMDK